MYRTCFVFEERAGNSLVKIIERFFLQFFYYNVARVAGRPFLQGFDTVEPAHFAEMFNGVAETFFDLRAARLFHRLDDLGDVINLHLRKRDRLATACAAPGATRDSLTNGSRGDRTHFDE